MFSFIFSFLLSFFPIAFLLFFLFTLFLTIFSSLRSKVVNRRIDRLLPCSLVKDDSYRLHAGSTGAQRKKNVKKILQIKDANTLWGAGKGR